MRRVKKWVSRVSLSVFATSSLYILFHLESYPELADYQSTPDRLLGLICILIDFI
jgi:hypothetical protein